MKKMYSNDVLDYLQLSGWKSDRMVDITEDIKLLKENELYVFKALEDVLVQYSGLEVKFTSKRHNSDDNIIFDIKNAINSVFNERLNEDYRLRIGRKISVIGLAYRGYMTLLIDEYGAIYGGFDDFLVKFGDSIEQAITVIITDGNIQRIE